MKAKTRRLHGNEHVEGRAEEFADSSLLLLGKNPLRIAAVAPRVALLDFKITADSGGTKTSALRLAGDHLELAVLQTDRGEVVASERFSISDGDESAVADEVLPWILRYLNSGDVLVGGGDAAVSLHRTFDWVWQETLPEGLNDLSALKNVLHFVSCGERDGAPDHSERGSFAPTVRFVTHAMGAGISVRWQSLPGVVHRPTREMETMARGFLADHVARESARFAIMVAGSQAGEK